MPQEQTAAAAASDWKQTLRAGFSKPGSAAGRPAGSAAPPQHIPLSEKPEREDKSVYNLRQSQCDQSMKTKGFIF